MTLSRYLNGIGFYIHSDDAIPTFLMPMGESDDKEYQ